MGRLPADDVEDFFQDHRRGERPARIEQRGELAVLFLLLAVHAGVVDGHGSRDGKQRGAPLVCFAEAAQPLLLDEREAADHGVLEDKRHSQRRELAPLVHEAGVGGVLDLVVGVGLAVLPSEDHLPVGGALVQAHARPHPGVVLGGHLTRPASRRDDGLGVGVVFEEVALPDVERFGDAPSHRGQHVLEHDGRGDGRSQLAGEGVVTGRRRRGIGQRLCVMRHVGFIGIPRVRRKSPGVAYLSGEEVTRPIRKFASGRLSLATRHIRLSSSSLFMLNSESVRRPSSRSPASF